MFPSGPRPARLAIGHTAKCMRGEPERTVNRSSTPVGLKTFVHAGMHTVCCVRLNSRYRIFIPPVTKLLTTKSTPIMSFVRPMSPMDLLSFNPCNLDHLTETYNIGFYLEYFTKWPSLCKVVESETGEIEAYSMRLSHLSAYYQNQNSLSSQSLAKSKHRHSQHPWNPTTLA